MGENTAELRRNVAESRANKPFASLITRIVSGYTKGSLINHTHLSSKAWELLAQNARDPAHQHMALFVQMHKAFGKVGEDWEKVPWNVLMAAHPARSIMSSVKSEFTNLTNQALIELGAQGKIVFNKDKKVVRIIEEL